MSNYFDEHNCQELADGQGPVHLMHYARLLIDTGVWNQEEFASHFSQSGAPPPASKKFIDSLDDVQLVNDEDEKNCPICLKNFEQDDIVNNLPCKHRFHSDCIKQWLQKTNSCPVCRRQYPTDDERYEEMMKHKHRQKEREQDIENLHNSMFG